MPPPRPTAILPTLLGLLLCVLGSSLRAAKFTATLPPSPENWPTYLGRDARTGYSPLAQIDALTAARLEEVWRYRSPRREGSTTAEWRSQPIIVDGELFTATIDQKLVALDAATGTEKWRFDPAEMGGRIDPLESVLGVAWWSEPTSRRVFFISNGVLHAVAADTGQAIVDFGNEGRLDLRPALLNGTPEPTTAFTAPATVLGDLVVCAGKQPNDSGCVYAFDARTGARAWAFDSDVDPGCVIAADAERTLLFFTTISGDLICLDGREGREVWRRETSYRQQPWAPPVLCTLRRAGRSVPAVVLATSDGRVSAFDRTTGDRIFADLEGLTAIPEEDAAGNASGLAADPENGLYLTALGGPIAAVDLASHRIRWRGTFRRPTKNVPMVAGHEPSMSGGNPLVTGGNLVFRCTWEGLHAIEASTGTTLWTAPLGAPATAAPVTYRAQGRQFVIVAAGDSLVAFALPLAAIAKPAAVPRPPERFEDQIAGIEARLREHPASEGIAFYGSSTFTRWNIARAFPDLPVVNLGFGGSQISDLNHFANRVLLPARPRLVVFYCGNNDVGANFSFDEIVDRYRAFSAWMAENLPQSHVLVLGNLPTPRRWTLWPDLHLLNARIAHEVALHPRQHYVDATHVMLHFDGHLRRDRISSDNLHLNAAGNAALAEALRPAIDFVWERARGE